MKRAYGLDVPETLTEALDPERTALIVYDMQVGIMRQLQRAAEITAKVAQVLAAARAAGIRTCFLRHTSLPKNLMGVFQLRQALAWQRKTAIDEIQPWFLRGSESHEIVPELAPRDTEAVFDKIGMSAFEGTPVDTMLRDCGIRAFLIVGVAMEIGIEPTVRHGADLGLIPVVPRDACGAGNAEAGARSLASIAFMGDALVTDTDELCARLTDARPGG